MNILQACRDPELFAPWFREPDSWAAWFAFLKVLFGLKMTQRERAIYRNCSARSDAPNKQCDEAWLVVGRRGGKSFVLALIAVFLACFRDWKPFLAPGEQATIMCLAADRKQARVILGYIRSLLKEVSLLAPMIVRETAETIDLNNRVTIEVHTASFRTVRGYTIVAALLDEVAFWRSDESANPDREVLNALRPAMATVPGAMLLCASSPYAPRGALFQAYRDHYGKDGDPILVWQADTRAMNPSVPQRVIDEAMGRDAASASAEYGAVFRADVETFVSQQVLESLIIPSCFERPPLSDTRYVAFTDPSGGSRDSMTLAVAHWANGVAVVDALRERRPPFSPDGVVSEFVDLLKSYRIGAVYGDRYGGEWPRERFRQHGIEYYVSDRPKSDLYRDLLPGINSGTIELLDNSRLLSQLAGLERRTARSGRDSIDHPAGGFDDLANAAAGAIQLAASLGRDPPASEVADVFAKNLTLTHPASWRMD